MSAIDDAYAAILASPEPHPARALLGQQIDLDGGLHDIAAGSERLRLFEPAPAQLPGQAYIDVEEER